MSERLLELGERAVKMAEKLGADQAEAYVGQSSAFVIDVENSAIRVLKNNVTQELECGPSLTRRLVLPM